MRSPVPLATLDTSTQTTEKMSNTDSTR